MSTLKSFLYWLTKLILRHFQQKTFFSELWSQRMFYKYIVSYTTIYFYNMYVVIACRYRCEIVLTTNDHIQVTFMALLLRFKNMSLLPFFLPYVHLMFTIYTSSECDSNLLSSPAVYWMIDYISCMRENWSTRNLLVPSLDATTLRHQKNKQL